MIDFFIRLLMEANLLNTRGTVTLTIIAALLLFLFISSILKRAIKLVITTGLMLAVFSCAYLAKVNVVDNNNLEFTATYVKSPNGQISYDTITDVTVSNDKKKITIYSESGDSMVLSVDTAYANAIKGGLEKMAEVRSKVK